MPPFIQRSLLSIGKRSTSLQGSLLSIGKRSTSLQGSLLSISKHGQASGVDSKHRRERGHCKHQRVWLSIRERAVAKHQGALVSGAKHHWVWLSISEHAKHL